jgi:alpha-ketoglutarate-dependent taurine dioxygenase
MILRRLFGASKNDGDAPKKTNLGNKTTGAAEFSDLVVLNPLDPARTGLSELLETLGREKQAIFDRLHRYGAVLVRGFDVQDQDQFLRIARLFTPNLMDYVGGDSPRSEVGDNVYTSTEYPAQFPISLHNELSFSNIFPRYLYFFCDVPPETGGETPLMNCCQLLRALPSDLRERFESRKLKYVQNLHDGFGIGKSWQETFMTEDPEKVENHLNNLGAQFTWKEDNTLHVEETVKPVIDHPITGEQVFFSQADQWHPSNLDEATRTAMLNLSAEEDLYHNCFYGDGGKIDDEDLDTIRGLVDRDMVKFPWQKGDILLVDNVLTMHGRSPFTGDRRILVAMGSP